MSTSKRLLALALAAGLALCATAQAEAIDAKFTANGKAKKLSYATCLVARDAASGEPSVYMVVLGEKPPADGAVTVNSVREGEVGDYVLSTFSAPSLEHLHDRIVHEALSFAAINEGSGGALSAEGLKLENGMLSGRLHTDGEEDFYGDKVSLDVSFVLPVK